MSQIQVSLEFENHLNGGGVLSGQEVHSGICLMAQDSRDLEGQRDFFVAAHGCCLSRACSPLMERPDHFDGEILERDHDLPVLSSFLSLRTISPYYDSSARFQV